MSDGGSAIFQGVSEFIMVITRFINGIEWMCCYFWTNYPILHLVRGTRTFEYHSFYEFSNMVILKNTGKTSIILGNTKRLKNDKSIYLIILN